MSGPVPARARWRRPVAVAAGVLLALVLLVLAGPRNAFGPQVPTPREAAPADLSLLDGWLARSEARWPGVRPDTAKGVSWATAAGQRSPWAVVYVHGFSASRQETAPLADVIARELGANLFYTRLTGHGGDPMAMGDATVQDWLADIQEALRIGHLLGQRVLLIGVSHGATLSVWQALQRGDAAQGVDAMALISPNFGPRDKRSELINAPWGRQLALALEGEMRGRLSDDPRENRAWIRRYPTRALFPMMALVRQVRQSDLSQLRTPVLVLYAEGDRTVDPQETVAAFARLGSAQKTLERVDYSKARDQHVLAGDLRDPQATAPMARRIVDWLRSLQLPAPG